MPAPTQILGEYEVLERLGAGGMGQVFKARHKRMDRQVAMKLITPARRNDPDAIRRFEREVRAAAKLSHPNIVAAYDAGEQDGQVYLVMELVEGTDLSRLVQESGPLPMVKAVELIRQAAAGLHHAHEQGFVHRDVKPSNLFLSHEGTVKVLDLGLAGPTATEREETELTRSGQIMGSVAYMAPEQAVSTRTVDRRADIYSLGCTLHYLLCGSPPFPGKTLGDQLIAHQSGEMPDLTSKCGASPELNAVFQGMVAKSPGHRFSTMQAVVEKLAPLTNAAVATTVVRSPSPGSGSTDSIAPYVSSPSTPTNPFAAQQSTSTKRWQRSFWIAGVLSAFVLGIVGLLIVLNGGKGKKAPEEAALGNEKTDATKTGSQGDDGKKQPPAADWPTVLAELKRLNPGLTDADAEYGMEGGDYKLTLSSAAVTDISPVTRLPVGHLSLFGTNVTNLAPLKGTRIWILGLPNVTRDVSALKDMPNLQHLAIYKTQVKSLQQLSKCTKLWYLDIHATSISSLEPLRNLKRLEEFDCNGTDVTDLEPLRELPLKSLSVNDTHVSDLSPLSGMTGLTYLDCNYTKVTSLDPLKGLPLGYLNINGNEQISDLSPVANAPLYTLYCEKTNVVDLSPLKRTNLEELYCAETPVASFAGLEALPLTTVIAHHTKVASLQPLNASKLEELDISNTEVADLMPLKGAPLKKLSCRGTKVTDLSPLRDAPLRELTADVAVIEKSPFLRSSKTLKKINGRPAAEFSRKQSVPSPLKEVTSGWAIAAATVQNVYLRFVHFRSATRSPEGPALPSR